MDILVTRFGGLCFSVLVKWQPSNNDSDQRRRIGMKYGDIKQRVEDLYIDYFNHFLTIDRFAEYYGLSVRQATRIIHTGRRINRSRGA